MGLCSYVPVSMGAIIITLLLYMCSCSNAEMCSGIQYNHGYWVRRKEPPSASENFELCSYSDFHLQPICTEKAVPKVLDFADTCKDKYYSENPNATSYFPPAMNYTYKPALCELAVWDEVQFCKVLGDRRVLMVGDSTMFQTAESLRSMLYQGRARASNYTIDSCFDQIDYFGSDNVVHYNGEDFTKKLHRSHDRGSTLLQRYARYGREGQYSFIIFGTGYHWHMNFADAEKIRAAKENISNTDDKFDHQFEDYLIPRLEEEIANIRDLAGEIGGPYKAQPTFILKTENPAHKNCQSYHAPDNSLFNPTRYANANSNTTYEWDKEYEIDVRLMNMALRNDVNIIRMDPLFQRPDGHTAVECLHYCAPGPVNLFGRLFLHFLTVGEEKWRQGYNYVPMEDPR